jgi:Ran GTPase-activating protein (RanGAP) involved in mRNA processing and transport
MSADLVSVKGQGIVFKTAEDCKALFAEIEANPNATKITLSGNSWGVEAIQATAEKLASLPLAVRKSGIQMTISGRRLQ